MPHPHHGKIFLLLDQNQFVLRMKVSVVRKNISMFLENNEGLIKFLGPLDKVSWPLYNYKPEVAFAIAHHEHELFLKYYVKENSVRVVHREINDTVHKDSCVEIFIGFEEDAVEGLFLLILIAIHSNRWKT